jgi:hypothetical protein
MSDLDHARACLHPLAAERRARGRPIAPEQLARAAALLTDLWAAAERHGITRDQVGATFHLPRAALDSVTAAARSRHRPRNRARSEVPNYERP